MVEAKEKERKELKNERKGSRNERVVAAKRQERRSRMEGWEESRKTADERKLEGKGKVEGWKAGRRETGVTVWSGVKEGQNERQRRG